jgi:pSer/pThr/pTyr-binding forkhead associated (FHA) protein
VRGNGHPEPDLHLELVGTEGLLKGHRLKVPLGESVVVGRSRSCDLSTRRSKAFLRATEEVQRRILADRAFLMVSRRHVQVTYHSADRIEIRDLSQNGTFVDDRRVDRAILSGVDDGGVEIRLSRSETLRLRATR